MTLWNKIATFRKTPYAAYVVMAVFLLGILFQCLWFHWSVYGSLNYVFQKCSLFLIKLSIAGFIASFSLLCKRHYGAILVSLIIGFWSMAEMVYYRSNTIFIEEYSLLMVGNMDGVWDSVWLFNEASDWLFLLPSVLLTGVVLFFQSTQRCVKSFAVVAIIAFVLNIIACINLHVPNNCAHQKCRHGIKVINPFASQGEGTLLGFTTEHYIMNTSVVHTLVYQLKELVLLPFKSEKYTLTNDEELLASQFIQPVKPLPTPKTSLIVLLIESFESWAITPDVTPNLCRFIEETPHLLYAPHVKQQVRHGVSADGQMIVNTGLLPVTDGATCFRFSQNEYPAISKLYQHSGLIAAVSLSYWNQKFMSDAYGIDQNYVVESWHDKKIFQKVADVKNQHDFLLSLTMTMHAPFNATPEQNYPKAEGMPDEMHRYLNAVMYMDKQLGVLLDSLMHDPVSSKATIVITADHNVLSKDDRRVFNESNKAHHLGFGRINGDIPLVIYSPQLEQRVMQVKPICQMDIYTTLLHLLGCESYYWKGFGVNVLHPNPRSLRIINAKEAQKLSDKLIRANYFERFGTYVQ